MTDAYIPYGRQSLSEDEIRAVVEVLRSDWLTQGPWIERFEQQLASTCGARHAIAVSSGTAALHLAALAAGIGPGSEAITSPITFLATANCLLYVGGRPVLADIDPRTLCLDPAAVAARITPSTRALLPVHFAGHPCAMAELRELADAHGLVVIEDASHALGARYSVDGRWYRVGECAHSAMTIFSFHPVKVITTGEGGAITTNDDELARLLRELRSHGVTRDPARFEGEQGPWHYEMQALGFNYRLTDFQSVLGAHQLARLGTFVTRRRAIASRYHEAFSAEPELILPREDAAVESAYHLYPIQLRTIDRRRAFDALRRRNLGVNVHYIPLHHHPYYARTLGWTRDGYPNAERYFARALTIPLFPAMSEAQVERVITAVLETVAELRR